MSIFISAAPLFKLRYALACFAFLLLTAAGCARITAVNNENDLERLLQRQGMGHLYYIGSQGNGHFFVTKYFGERTRYYKISSSGFDLKKTFPKTMDESKWVPYLHDISCGTDASSFKWREQVPALDK
jgi:hypothetical protein